MNIAEYLNLHKQRAVLKHAFSNTLSKELDNVYAQFDKEIDSILRKGMLDGSITSSSFKILINNFTNRFNSGIDSSAAKAGRRINVIYRGLYNILGYEDEFDEITLPVQYIDNFQIKREVQTVITKLRNGDITENRAKRAIRSRLRTPAHVVNTILNTNLAGIDNSSTHNVAVLAGLDDYLYFGPDSEKSRPFCREHVGHIYSLQELETMNNGQGLPVQKYCGGYNCLHELIPVDRKWKELTKMNMT